MNRALIVGFSLACACSGAAYSQHNVETDAVSREASQLEAELNKYRDTSPEAGDALFRLTELYHGNGRVLGLVRSAQRFVSAHPTDPRHSGVMLRLLDGLVVLSRHREFTVIARQFLTRYPQAAECGTVEQRLAATLETMGERQRAAEVYRDRWQREPNPNGRRFGVKACELFSQSGNAGIQQGAELASQMFARLPKDEFARRVARRSVAEYRRVRDWAKSNAIGKQLVDSKLVKDPEQLRQLHWEMAENYSYQGQHANAAQSLAQVRSIRDDQKSHWYHIQRIYDSGGKAPQLQPLVRQYFDRYKDRADRYDRIALLAHALHRDGNTTRAVEMFRELLPTAPRAHSAASQFVSYNGSEPEQLKDTEQALLAAIAKNPDETWYLRYTLGFNLYRDRMKDEARARGVLREFIRSSPTDDGHTSNVISWLLSTAPDDNAFRSDVQAILKSRREYLHLRNFRSYPSAWVSRARRDRNLRERADQLKTELDKADSDPVTALFLKLNRGPHDRSESGVRAQLLEPGLFSRLNKELQRYVLWNQAYYFQHYSPGDQRSSAASLYARLVKLDPDNIEYRQRYLQVATDYGQPEVAKEAALVMLQAQPTANNADVWRRLLIAADKNTDAGLARRALEWISASRQKFGSDSGYASYLGDTLLKLELENEAVAYWTEHSDPKINHYESRECASRLMARIEDPRQKAEFAKLRFAADTDFHGRYAMWLADLALRRGDLATFEQTLGETVKRHRDRPFAGWDVDAWGLHYLLHNYRSSHQDYRQNEQENTPENILRVARAIRDVGFDWPSAQAELMVLEAEASDAQKPIDRLIAWQKVTRQVHPDSHRWDQLFPFAQNAVTRQDYSVAATLLTGMLGNITNVNDDRRQRARNMIGQCYARLGTVGLTIDESSPIAPLLQAALYLRLGDESLALETYLANRQLFDRHRDEVPVDLVVFVCESLMAAGGEENHERVEDILRNWIIRNSELETVEDETKARIQYLLARNYFGAKRFDVARSEYTTVMNRYPSTSFAIEAEFGIGETFMAQKVYDQAAIVFEKLAGSRDAEVIVRAEFLRGVLSHRRGDNDEARDIFRGVLERVPNIELANQALFNLAEVYGAEERYMDQLQLLMTVGRLGRVSKRQHSPGMPLSIVVQDSDLGISRGHNRIPVVVWTAPGGDQETLYLTSGGAGKGLFRVDVDTELGPVRKNDKVLQITGKDIIKCDYPDEFKSEFKSVPLSDVEIRIASDAQFEVASSRIVDEEEETFSERLEREARERDQADARQSSRRPSNQIKPGNPVYLRVKDGDRDLSDETDTVVARLVADSGDQVQVTLTESEPHSGVFEGTAKTGELPAGALASDTAIDHSPLMAIDSDPKTFWLSEPDGETPKTLTVDMKDLNTIARAKFSMPRANEHTPVRAELQASYDGEFWYRVSGYPDVPRAEPVADQFGPAQFRFYSVNPNSITDWSHIVRLVRNGQPVEQGNVRDGRLLWERPEGDEDGSVGSFGVVWFGAFNQSRDGAVRFAVTGYRTAIAVDGRVERSVTPGNQTVDVWLDKGIHELTIFTSGVRNTRQVRATRIRADLNRQNVTPGPFLTTDFAESPIEAATNDSQPADDAANVNSIDLQVDAAKFAKQTEQFGVVENGGRKSIGYWQALEDLVSWEFDASPGVYDVWMEFAHQGGGSEYVVEFGEQRINGVAANTGNWRTFREERVGTVSVDSGGRVNLTIRPVRIQNGSLLNLGRVTLRPATGARVMLSDTAWDFRFPPIDVRYARFVIHEYLGEAVAVSHVEVTGDDPSQAYIPTEADVLSLSQNDVLEIAGGDVVTASYTDEVTQLNAGGSRLLTGELQATYFNAAVTPIDYDFERRTNGAVDTIRKQLKRVEPGERIIVEIVDYDRDRSASPDQVEFEVAVNDGEPVRFAATETESYSGVFTKEIDTSAQAEADKLAVRQGDRVYLRYFDEQNTFPGHSVPRESVVYINSPTDARIRVLETRVIPPPEGSTAPARVTYHEPVADQEISNVAFEAPLTIEVVDPDAARDSRSEITVTLASSDGATADVRCVVSGRLSNVPAATAEDWALEEGRFIGQVILQLGSSSSPEVVPITPDMPRNLIGGGVLSEEETASSLDDSLVARVLNVTGKDRIRAVYKDQMRPEPDPQDATAGARLISNGSLACTDREYDKPASQLHVGEKLFLMVTDADQDTSDERDPASVVVTSEFGERETVTLVETLAHSGVFTGSFTLKSNDKPTPENLQPDDPVIECYFGDTVFVTYVDPAASTESGELELTRQIPVVIGTDGLVAAFSKTFNDETLAVETRFHIAESYFELFKSHRELGRSTESQTDLAAGRRILREVMEDYPDPKYAPRIAYLLGQFAQELGDWAEAAESYEMIVRRFPDHPLAADAQYKLAQSHEESGNFDEALEAYVTLAATYPKSPLIANVMIRISDHFYKAAEFDVAAQVGEKFLERFEGHQYASRIAFRIGQCKYKSETYVDASAAFDRFAKLFPDDDLCSDALFWSGESFRLANNNREAFRRYNRCRWDFPESEAAQYSRGRLALPEMLQQFEAEARSVEDQ